VIEKTLSKEFVDLAKEQRENEDELLTKDNVVGVALGNKIKNGEDTGEPSFHVLVQHKLEADLLSKQDMVPKTIKGTKTDVIEVGQIVAGPLAPDIEPINHTRFGLDSNDITDWNMHEEIDEILSETQDRVKPRPQRRSSPSTKVSPEQLHQRS